MESLTPLPYHANTIAHLKAEHPSLWRWFASDKARINDADQTRLELLKSTVRLDEQTHPRIYTAAKRASQALDLADLKITCYQASNHQGVNAALWFLPDEAQVVLSGPIAALLDDDELTCLFGHELSHYKLWSEGQNMPYLTADRMLNAMAWHSSADQSHIVTAQRYQLYTEAYADRGGLLACGKLNSAISCLLKVQTGLEEINTDAYLKQAEEVFATEQTTSKALTHPESFIRARALQNWHQQDNDTANEALARMIEGLDDIHNLDMLRQQHVEQATRRFIQLLLKPTWFQTEATLAHAKLFFDDFAIEASSKVSLEQDQQLMTGKLVDYWCYLILDFATVDDELEDYGLLRGLQLADELELQPQFEKTARNTLKITKKRLEELKNSQAHLLAQLVDNKANNKLAHTASNKKENTNTQEPQQ